MAGAKKKKKKDDYGHSAAKFYLEEDLLTGRIPLDWKVMSWQDVFATRPEFAQFHGARLFQKRLQRARARAKRNHNTGAQEMAALKKDRELFSKKTTTHQGGPVWEGSLAQAYLILDVRLGNHKNKTPEQFCMTRPAYSDFSLKVFRNHIYQQEKRIKWIAHLEADKKKKYNLPENDD